MSVLLGKENILKARLNKMKTENNYLYKHVHKIYKYEIFYLLYLFLTNVIVFTIPSVRKTQK